MKKNIFIFFTILLLASCKSTRPPEFWQIIIDSIPWEDRIIGYVSMGALTVPDGLSSIMYDNGYLYVNSTYLKEELEEHIYELKRENTTYYSDDDTFVFAGEFYPDGSNIWLVFSKDENYSLWMGPNDINDGKYNLGRTKLTKSSVP
jgi:hypothetical protein